MSEGIHASYSKVGTALVLGVSAILGSLIYFGGLGAKRDALIAEMYCSTSAGGLSVGSDVNFRGVKVGEVKRITFLGGVYDDIGFENLRTVYIEIAFDTRQLAATRHVEPEEVLGRMLRHGLYGKIDTSGITGLAKINLDMPEKGGGGSAAPKTYPWRPEHQVIPLAPSMMESLSETMTKVMGEINKIDIVSAWSNLNTVAESAEGLVRALDARVNQLSDGFAAVISDVDDLVNRLKYDPSLLIRGAAHESLQETR